MKIGIVCEGGGMRGVFTAGVLQAFMESGFMADELVGVSAGASNGVSYVSGQQGRGYRTNVDYAGDKRYASFQSFRQTGSFFGMDFIFGEIPDTLDPFNFETFAASPCDFYAGATDMETGQAVFFGKDDVQPGLHVIRASCSMPLLSPIVEYNGRKYLDGGISAPIPIDKALNDGCDKLLVVLTRERGYRKKPQRIQLLYHNKYHQYPNFVRTMNLRHLVYNHTLERLARLETSGRAIIIAPPQPLPVDRMGKDRDKLIAGYNVGLEAGFHALDLL
ncbi:MAG: patatin family protein [Ruminococcaceae bacterium]|nr:patatin family protein [Oscillospiraceae bacterium]